MGVNTKYCCCTVKGFPLVRHLFILTSVYESRRGEQHKWLLLSRGSLSYEVVKLPEYCLFIAQLFKMFNKAL